MHHSSRIIRQLQLDAAGHIYEQETLEYASVLHGLAEPLWRLNLFDVALRSDVEALAIRQRLIGMQNNTEIAASLHRIAVIHQGRSEFHVALGKYKEALKMRIAIQGHEHIEVAMSLNNIGVIHDKLGDVDLALEKYEEALQIKIKILGKYDLDVASSLNNIGVLLDEQGRFDAAIERHQETCGSGSSDWADTILMWQCHWTISRSSSETWEISKRRCRITTSPTGFWLRGTAQTTSSWLID